MSVKVFLSWSGDESRDVASTLRNVLPLMLQGIKVFMSEHDIQSGEKWENSLSKNLNDSNFGLFILNKQNYNNPWILFEAGAISKINGNKLCCLLMEGLSPAEIKPPLSQFQNKPFKKQDIKQLLSEINDLMDGSLSASQFDFVFQRFWPDIDNGYNEARKISARFASTPPQERSSDELLSEILLIVRALARERYQSSIKTSPQENSINDILNTSISLKSIEQYTKWKFPDLPISSTWQHRMFLDLDASKYVIIKNIDDVVELAKPAVMAYSIVAPEKFRSGTGFITKSLGFVDLGFRKSHPFSSETLDAFQKYAHLLI